MPFGRRSPLETLALPGVILAYKYSQFRQRRREAASRRVTERELSALHHKIDKLLSKLEESEPEPPTSQEDECVICINARATMQTSPCGHRVVCRRCFVKTIQSAVAQRLLPLRCVICRARINRLTSGSGSWRLQGSASSYSMGSKSWGVPGSASSYSVGARVAPSASLYSMSSGSSCMSGVSNVSSCSGGSSTSGLSSSSSVSGVSGAETTSNHHHLHHKHHSSCSNGCLGAIPRNPAYAHAQLLRNKCHQSSSFSAAKTARNPDLMMQNRLPTIKEFRSPAKLPLPSPSTHATNSRIRYASYTSKANNNSIEMVPLLTATDHPAADSTTPNLLKSNTTKLGMSSKVSPMNSKLPMNKTNMAATTASGGAILGGKGKSNINSGMTSSISPRVFGTSNNSNNNNNNNKSNSSSSNCGGSNSKQEEKTDNKKNETMEKKKKEEKAKLKAEKEARKEEKRLAKEEERLAKMLAKEEKKRNKKEAKEILLAADSVGRK